MALDSSKGKDRKLGKLRMPGRKNAQSIEDLLAEEEKESPEDEKNESPEFQKAEEDHGIEMHGDATGEDGGEENDEHPLDDGDLPEEGEGEGAEEGDRNQSSDHITQALEMATDDEILAEAEKRGLDMGGKGKSSPDDGMSNSDMEDKDHGLGGS